jgi:hypothetical protein
MEGLCLCTPAHSFLIPSTTLRQHSGRSGEAGCPWLLGHARFSGPCECPCAPEPEQLAMRCTTLSSRDVNTMPAKKQNVAYLHRDGGSPRERGSG